MESNYDRSLRFVLEWEGGYSNSKFDPGGETNYGVTRKVYEAFLRRVNRVVQSVRKITMGEVGEIYRTDYWNPTDCPNLPWPLDIITFDTAINCGVSRAINWRRLSHDMGSTDMERAAAMIQLRDEHYKNIILRNPKLAKFRNGWNNRLESLRDVVGL